MIFQKGQWKNNDILSPLPDKYKNAIQIRHYHETGIAWVRKIGNLWVYGKRIDGKYVSIKDSNIYKLHKKVLKDGHVWGIINQEKAEETLFNAQPINTINSSPKEKQAGAFVNIKRDIISIEGKIKNKDVLTVLAKIYEYEDDVLKMNAQKQDDETAISITLELPSTQISDFKSEIEEFEF